MMVSQDWHGLQDVPAAVTAVATGVLAWCEMAKRWRRPMAAKGDFEVFDTAEAARRLGVPQWQVCRVYEDKLLPDPPRVGRNRAIRPDDLPLIEASLRKKGYIE